MPRGFSLAEVMLALAFFALAVASLATVLIGGMRQLTQSNQFTQAGSLAHEEMERIQEGAYLYRASDYNFDGRVPTPKEGGFPPGPYPSVDRGQQYQLVVTSSTVSSRLRDVKVQVRWQPDHQFTLETVMHK